MNFYLVAWEGRRSLALTCRAVLRLSPRMPWVTKLPEDVLEKVPTEADWRAEPWCLDIPNAYRNFFGKTVEEAEALFNCGVMAHQEDVAFMPAIPKCYYLQAYSRYLLSERSRGDADNANCYLSLIALMAEYGPRVPPALERLINETLDRIGGGQDFFDAEERFYGSFKDRAAKARRFTTPENDHS